MREPTNYEKERIRQLLECLTEDIEALIHPAQREYDTTLFGILGTMGANLEALRNMHRKLRDE